MTALDLNFERDGAVVLRRAFDPSGIADRLWGFLERRYGHARNDPTTWSGKLGKGVTGFGKTKGLPPIMTDVVSDEITRLLGSVWTAPQNWAPLITFPRHHPWFIPHGGWHIDYPVAWPLPMLRLFGYFATVAPGGGGTLIVAGSHRLAEQHAGKTSKDFRTALAEQSRWFHDLWHDAPDTERNDRFMVQGSTVNGVPVRVVELVGEPGDVVIWHPSLLHCIAPNSLDQPRFMFTHTARRAAI